MIRGNQEKARIEGPTAPIPGNVDNVSSSAGGVGTLQQEDAMSAVKIEEYQAINETVQHYLDGGRTGRGELMRPAFHADATIYGYVGPDLFAGPIQGLFDWNDKNGAAKDVVVNVTILQVVETVAVVRVEADNWTGQRYTDFLTLLKVDSRWKIMQKVFHHHAA